MEPKKNEDFKKYVRFSGVGVQMGVIIAGFSYLGVYLDEKSNNKTQIYTISLALLGVCIGLYIVIREVINMSKDDDKK
jgi:F0F1-type ATP synthase assembly protein I